MTMRPDQPHIGLVVEGAGDFSSVPLLLRRYFQEKEDYRDILGKPIPTKGISNATKENGIEGYAATAAYRPGCRGILIVLDSDNTVPLEREAALRGRIEGIVVQPFIVSLAVRDYEGWLYASIESLELGEITYLQGVRGLSVIKDAVKELSGESYTKPIWQPRLTQRMNISLARSRNPSLDRMLQGFDTLAAEIPQ